ncbi:alpha-2-macroglobulin family protein [Pseudooceanicola sp. MF1-13]|uniref:alpha-2-macroglobulin family protein n=1 Tax=Pseudooceanicola sp. MF1-13 TaxID=3379095 RepID=UPI003891596D
MSRTSVILAAILGLMAPVVTAPEALAQALEAPDKRMIVTMDQDFVGADLSQMFDTTFEACRSACEAQTECTGFTFNSRSNSCFPKTDITGMTPYVGAQSARIVSIRDEIKSLMETRSDDLAYLGNNTLRYARGLAREIGWIHPSGQYSMDDMLRATYDRQNAGNMVDAMRWMGGAVATSDNSDHWAEYARLLLAAAPTAGSNQRRYIQRALPAAINAYLRATSDPARATTLVTLSQALQANGRGRDMIPTLRLAERLQPREDIVAALDDAINKYGFRVSDNEVRSDQADPQICAEFTEPLVKAGINYADYVQLPDQTMAVEASGNQICVRGLNHGERYTVTFREGLPAASGEELVRDVTIRSYVRDRSPLVNFPGRAYVLPAAGEPALPIDTVNLDQVDLMLYHVTDRNILQSIRSGYFGERIYSWDVPNFESSVAEKVWEGQGDTSNTLNQTMTSRLPMGDVLADQMPGVYVLSAAVPGDDEAEPAFQWFILTDLGLTTMQGNDGLHVFLRGLGDAQPRAGVELSLIGRANRVLGSATTDEDGYARFDPGLSRGTGGAAPALILAEDGDDLAFLSLTDPAFDLSDRGVAGREPSPPVDVFMTTDRGAYRAGEVIHLTALARDGVAKAVTGLPITAILTRPDGVEYARMTSTRDVAGGHVFAMPLGQTVPRGSWRIEVKADVDAPALASTRVLVEDFLPERIDVTLDMPEGVLTSDDLPPVSVQADYLFGAPGADLDIEGTGRLTQTRRLETHPGYVFGRYDADRFARTVRISGTTDAAGFAEIAVEPPFPDTGLGTPYELTATIGVAEGSGRPVERQITRVIGPDAPIIGIKPQFDDAVPEGAEAGFDLIALAPDLTAAPMQVKWTVNRVSTRYQWYQQYGNWNWEPFTTRSKVAEGTAMLGEEPVSVSAPTDWGRYEIVVERMDGDYVASSLDFSSEWYAPASAGTTPDMLELALDKPEYAVDEWAQVRLVPRHAGTALVTVISDRLIEMKTVEVTEGENIVNLKVTPDWGAGAYVTASVIRPMEAEAGQMPARAMGLSYAPVDPGAKALSVSIDTPDQANPRGPVDAVVRVDGLTAGQTAYATIAAVDVGILNLTAFDTPDPEGHYFGQRRLGMDIRDIYGRLIDSTQGAMGQVRSGGDASGGAGLQSPPPTEELVAYFAGPLTIGPDGTAQVSFDMPEFDGTVRYMAVAWTDTAVGAAEAEVLVRDPVVVTASLPRFLQPGDASSMLLEVVHATGPAGRVGLDVTAAGVELPEAVPSGFDLAEKGKQTFRVPVIADEVGDHTITVAITTPEGQQLTKTLNMPVRRNDPKVATTQRFSLAAGDTFTLDNNVFASYRPGSGEAIVAAGPLAQLDAPAMLAALDRYPYGCTEQVTSKAMPLLYLSSVAEAMGLASPAQLDQRIDQAIDRVLTRQATNGAFGLWRAESGDFWLDAYVTDFLSRAKVEGHDVPKLAMQQAVDNLRNRVNYAPDFDASTNGGGQDLAYALMVLAREGAATMGDLRYYADVKGDDFGSPLAAAQLGAALAMYGDQTRADAMFAIASRKLNSLGSTEEARLFRADYGTRLRDTAGVLSLAVEAGSDAVNRATLVSQITGGDRTLSTQESAWSLLAAKALLGAPASSGLTVNGDPVEGPFVHAVEGPFVHAVEAQTLTSMAIRNTTASDTAITLTTLGVPSTPVEANGYGYSIRREYFTTDGNAVDPSAVAQGTRLVTVLTVQPFDSTGARLMIDDPLPAGFEIDNPNLLRAGDVAALDWLDPIDGEYSEFRADRFLTAVNWSSDRAFQLAYIVRAISPGTYHHPAATVEDMYRPQYRANTSAGRVTIAE